MKKLLYLIGLRSVYICEWGKYEYRYDSIDMMSMRPVHKNMSVAPPWARLRLEKM